MRYQGLFLVGLAALAGISLAGGYPLPVMLLLPALVSYFWVRGRVINCVLIAGFAAAAPVVLSQAYVLGAVLLLAALAGVMLGGLMRAHLSLGKSIVVLSGLVFVLHAGYSGITWPAPQVEYRAALEAYSEQIQAEDDNADRVLSVMTWMGDNWLFTSFGIAFGVILLGATAIQYLLYRNLVLQDLISPVNRHFSQMRVPEHLVWVAIALAGLWFLDKWSPNDAVRFVAWNGAIAMTFVYWLNGLSIVACWIKILQPRPVFVLLLLVASFVFNFHQLFAVAGFFDTWFDFRLKISRLAAARKEQE